MSRRHLTTLVAGAAALAGCGLPSGEYFGAVPTVDDPRRLRWCNSGEPDNLDPAHGQSTVATPIIHALFDGLMIFDDAGLPTPGLAARYELSADQRRVTFELRPDARWSDGAPVTAYDVAFQASRVLHPLTGSVNSDFLDWMKGYDGFLGGRTLVELSSGELVEIVAIDGARFEDLERPPDPNLRRGSRPVALRDLGAPATAAYATAPAGADLTIVEVAGRPASPPSPDGAPWAFVFWDRGEGTYGWVPLGELDVAPNAARRFTVRPVPSKHVPGAPVATPEVDAAKVAIQREVAGDQVLLLPEALGVRVPDAHTVIFEAADPTPSLLAAAASRSLRPVPRAAVARRPRTWTRPDTIVTSGPLRLTAHEVRDHLTLTRSPTYRDPDDLHLDRVDVLSVDDQAASANLYFTGRCDAVAANHVPQSYLAALSTGRGGQPYRDYIVAPQLGVYFAVINTETFPNVHLRRALALALDRTRIADFLRGGEIGVASYTPGTPIAALSDEDLAACGVTRSTPGVALVIERGRLCYVPPRGLEYDPDAARAELALAKAELGAAFPRELIYKYNLGYEGHKLVAEYLQAEWRRTLGLRVRLEQQEWQVFLSDTRAGSFELARLGWTGSAADPEVEFLRLWQCGGSNNRARWCDRDFDRLLDEAAALSDPVARLAKVRAAEEVLIAGQPIIPMFNYTQKVLMRPYVRGLAVNFITQPSLWRAWRDPAWREAAR
jgi:ABC-type oligopeptide transport system substrate-binding subunit